MKQIRPAGKVKIDKTPAYNIALAIWRGDEYILSFFFATQLRFRQTNIAEQQNKQ